MMRGVVVRMGRQLRFREDALLAWIASGGTPLGETAGTSPNPAPIPSTEVVRRSHRQYAVSIPRHLADELRALRQEQAEQRKAWGETYEDHGLVFCQPGGRPLHERNLARRDFRRTAKRADVPQIRLYDLRHCNATHLADQGTPVHVVQRRLGHRRAATTLRHYTHVLEETERAAADRLAERPLGSIPDPGDSRG